RTAARADRGSPEDRWQRAAPRRDGPAGHDPWLFGESVVRCSLTLFALISCLAGASVPAYQGRDDGPLTFAAAVDLVVFNVTVTDRKGRHVSRLTQDDFVVSEDNAPQTSALFSAEDVPASVGLIIDNSGS